MSTFLVLHTWFQTFVSFYIDCCDFLYKLGT